MIFHIVPNVIILLKVDCHVTSYNWIKKNNFINLNYHVSTHKWLIKFKIHPKLPCGSKTLIKIILYDIINDILKLHFGYWKCLVVMQDIITNDIYNYSILIINYKYLGVTWINSYVIMASHMYGLWLQH